MGSASERTGDAHFCPGKTLPAIEVDSMNTRNLRALACGFFSLALIAPFTATSAHATATSSNLDNPTEAVFVVEPGGQELTPAGASTFARRATQLNTDQYEVTFDLSASGVIEAKTVSMTRATPGQNDEGRDRLGTFTINDQGEVTLSWWDPSEGTILWTIRRDDNVVATTRGETWTGVGLLGGSGTYEISGSKTVTIDGVVAQEPYLTVISVPEVDATPIGMEITSAVATRASSNTDVTANAAPGEWDMTFQLNTFIPTQYAPTPFDIQPCVEAYGGTGIGYYGGDGRSFAHGSVRYPSSRTSIEKTYTIGADNYVWNAHTSKTTSGTTLYDGTGKVLRTANADLSGITLVGSGGDWTGGFDNFAHHVSDPLCSIAPAIDYELAFGGYSSGRVVLFGEHDQAPSYEYRVSTGGNFMNLYTFENKGLQYLFPTFPNAHVDLNVNVSTP